MVLSAVDKGVYRDTRWAVGVDDDDVVTGLGFSVEEVWGQRSYSVASDHLSFTDLGAERAKQ
jgi:hypothetical protein